MYLKILFQCAKYYFEAGKDLKEPLAWLTKAVSIKNDNFYYFHMKAKIEAKLGDYKAATASAKKSLALAQEKKLKDWVKTNETLIAEWDKK